MLVLGRRVGEGIMIGHDIKVTVLVVAGDKVRIGIDAPKDICKAATMKIGQFNKCNRRFGFTSLNR